MRKWDVRSSVPVGEWEKEGEERTTELEKKNFEDWLIGRWREKDAFLDAFLREGKFKSQEKEEGEKEVSWPLRLRSAGEIPQTFSYFIPVGVVGLTAWGVWWVLGIVVRELGGAKLRGEL